MAVYSDNSESIGRTPLVKINRLTEGLNATVLAKIEGRNPAYSVKCRIGASMIWDGGKVRETEAWDAGRGTDLGEHGDRIGVRVCGPGLPADAHQCPTPCPHERRTMLRTFGAKLILTPGAEGMKGAIAKAEELAENPEYFIPQQFKKPREPGDPLQDDRTGNLGRYRRETSTSS